MEFKAFPKIERMGKLNMQVTQKIHGTNAQVFIIEAPEDYLTASAANPSAPSDLFTVDGKTYIIRAGSRTRWIYVGDDNYGFAAFVDAHKERFIRNLGIGQHFGEWAGPGINSGEGLTEKTFVLFDFWKYQNRPELPPQTVVVPVLYQGPADLAAVEAAMQDLKTNGSKLAPGFMRPEGCVVTLAGTRYKKVFDAEETQWTKSANGPKVPREETEFTLSHLLQPIRLEKLLSKDERLVSAYPSSLPVIAKEYVQDLIEEGQIVGDDGQIKAIKKQLGGKLFEFIKENVKAG